MLLEIYFNLNLGFNFGNKPSQILINLIWKRISSSFFSKTFLNKSKVKDYHVIALLKQKYQLLVEPMASQND